MTDSKSLPKSPKAEKAFRDFAAMLSEAADVVVGPLGGVDEREQAEGFRHLFRLISLAQENLIEKADRERPAFTRWMSQYRKLLGDNPYTIYDNALIHENGTYKISGHLGETTYLGVCVYSTNDNGDRGIVGNVDDTDLEIEEDGSFELYLSATRPEGAKNWLELTAGTMDVLVRQYFLEYSADKEAQYTIEQEPSHGVEPPLTDGVIAERINAAAEFVSTTLHVETTISAFSASATPTQLRDGDHYEPHEGQEGEPTIDLGYVSKAMPTPAILYSGSWINDLGDDEAVVVRGKAPDARYWSVQLLNRWMESPDYFNHDCFFTPANIELEDDGSLEIYVSHKDPGKKNWLSTTGYRYGQITVRALHCKDDALELEFERVTI